MIGVCAWHHGRVKPKCMQVAENFSSGMSAIILVPEISLTPQMTNRSDVVWQQGGCSAPRLTQRQRWNEWNRIRV